MEELTVETLIEHLKKFPPKTPVGIVGHYGEFYPMDAYNISKYRTYREGTPRSKRESYFDAINISPPDIGPEPD